jgi:hypothetical protein
MVEISESWNDQVHDSTKMWPQRGNLFSIVHDSFMDQQLPPDDLLLDSAPNLGPLILYLVWKLTSSKLPIQKCQDFICSRPLKLLFQQFLNLSSYQRDMSGPILGDLSKNR